MNKYEDALALARMGKPIQEIFPELTQSFEADMRDYLVRMLENAYKKGEDYIEGSYFDRALEWLKSTAPQAQWKPTKEMLLALKEVGHGGQPEPYQWAVLDNLYNELKNL